MVYAPVLGPIPQEATDTLCKLPREKSFELGDQGLFREAVIGYGGHTESL